MHVPHLQGNGHFLPISYIIISYYHENIHDETNFFMEISPSEANQQRATRKIVSIQWEQKPVIFLEVNTGRLYSDGKQSAERIPKPCRAWKKAGLVEISSTPGNINSILVEAKSC